MEERTGILEPNVQRNGGWRAVWQWPWLPLVVVVAALACAHVTVPMNISDDAWFYEAAGNTTVWEFLPMRYQTTNSRTVIEFFLFLLIRRPAVWRVLDVGAFTLLLYSLMRLVGERRRMAGMWLAALFCLIPMAIYSSGAGWVATTLNYIWPAAGIAYALLLVHRAQQGQKIHVLQWIAGMAAAVYGCNAEQFCAVFLGLVAAELVYGAVCQKRVSPFAIVMALVAVGSLVFIFTAPGTAARYQMEVSHWYPDYGSLGILDKAYLGIQHTAWYVLGQQNFLFLAFCLLVCAGVFRKSRSWWWRGTALFPCALAVYSNLPEAVRSWVLPTFSQRFRLHCPDPRGDLTIVFSKTDYLYTVAAVAACVCLCLCLYVIGGRSVRTGMWLLGFLGGVASCVVLGFSPTIYASVLRVFILWNFCLLGVTVNLVTVVFDGLPDRRQWQWTAVAAGMGGVCLLESLSRILP